MKKNKKKISSFMEITAKLQSIDESQSGQIKGGFLSFAQQGSYAPKGTNTTTCNEDNHGCVNTHTCNGSNTLVCKNTYKCSDSSNDGNCANTSLCIF